MHWLQVICPKNLETQGVYYTLEFQSARPGVWKYTTNDSGNRTAAIMSTLEDWLDFSDGLEKYLSYLEFNNFRHYHGDNHHELMEPLYSCQNDSKYNVESIHTDRTKPDSLFWGGTQGSVFRVPLYGLCWFFAYLHSWNATHPLEQYDNIYDFVAQKINTNPITVDSELNSILTGGTWEFYNVVKQYYPSDYFNVGKTILATDLPASFKRNGNAEGYSAIGAKGEASWGIRQALGWTGERLTVTRDELKAAAANGDYTTWIRVKNRVVESIFAGKPVVFECVAYGSSLGNDEYPGSHAIAAIGYDGETDRFKFVDSGAGWQMDAEYTPCISWSTFEAMMEPSEESAVWIFDMENDTSKSLVPKPVSAFDKATEVEEKIGDIDVLLDAIIVKEESYISGGTGL